MKTFLPILCILLLPLIAPAQIKDSGYKGTNVAFVYDHDNKPIEENERKFEYKLVMYKGEFLIQLDGPKWVRATAIYKGKKRNNGYIHDMYQLSNGSTLAICLEEAFISWVLPRKEDENPMTITFYDIEYSFKAYMDGIDAWDTWTAERKEEQKANANYSVSSELDFSPEQDQPEEQGRFREDYNVVAKYDPETETWSEWESGYNTFVFNYNSNNDIKVIWASGKQAILRTLSGVEEDKTTEGHEYQMIKILDENGNEAFLQLFADPKVGLKLIWSNMAIQFAQE